MSITTHSKSKRRTGRVREHRPVTAAMKFRSSARWQKFRAWYRSLHPLCERCEPGGITKASEEVHHVIPLSERPDLGLDEDNDLALCRECH